MKNFTSLTCKDWQKGSTICVAKRNLASEHSEFVDFRCPPEDKQACMEPITRVEYQQRHLRRVTVNPETVFLFWITIVINVMTAMQLRTLRLCDIDEKHFTLTIAFIEQQFIADSHRQLDISMRYMPTDMDSNEPNREQFFRRERSLIQGFRCAEQLIKICNSSWRGRERMSMGDRRRKKILDIEARGFRCAEQLIKICNSSWRGRERMSMGDRRRKKILDIEARVS
uniref:CACTA en-spm transposon protein n=1 Tax=Ascaris lumbricoides TaxID=6252 RepID=A0A0M3IPX6_ASCLU